MPSPSFELSVNNVILCRQPESPLHLHAHVELKFVIEGEIDCRFCGVEHTLKAGQGVILFPFQAHSATANPDSLMLRILMSLDSCRAYAKTFREFIPCDNIFDYTTLHPELAALVKSAVEIHRTRSSFSATAVTQLMLAACGLVLDRLPLIRVEEEYVDTLNTYTFIVKWCTKHCREPLRLSDLADVLHLSERQLSRIFSEQLHMGFRPYINSLRLQKVIELLAEDTRSISEIAFECGFESISTFNRVFLDMMKQSPSEYRETALRSDPNMKIGLL